MQRLDSVFSINQYMCVFENYKILEMYFKHKKSKHKIKSALMHT